LEVTNVDGETASLTIPDVKASTPNIDLSIIFEPEINLAELLDLTIRARIVRTCNQFFLNTRTIRQTSPVTENFLCALEVEFKSDGLPKNDIVFELQHRGCDSKDPWEFSAAGKTNTSGPGIGEVLFNFKNDEKHCVYRVIGPINQSSTTPLSAQINTLRKEKFDND